MHPEDTRDRATGVVIASDAAVDSRSGLPIFDASVIVAEGPRQGGSSMIIGANKASPAPLSFSILARGLLYAALERANDCET